jgi:hypothetical protein
MSDTPNQYGGTPMGQAPAGSKNQNNNYGVLSPQAAKIYNSDESSLLAKFGLTLDQYNHLAQTNSISPELQSKVDAAINSNYSDQIFSHDNYLSNIVGNASLALSLGVATAGIGSGVAAAAGGGLGGAAAGGAAAGAAGAGLRDVLTGAPLTLGSVGKGAAIGAVGGAAAKGLNGAVSNATGLNSTLSSGLVKAGTGALGSAITGGNISSGALAGGISGLASGANSSFGGNALTGAIAGFGASQVSNYLGGALGGGGGGGGSAAAPSGTHYLGAGGQGNMAVNPQTYGSSGSTDSTLASTIGSSLPGVLQGAAGIYGSQNAAEKQTQADQNAINTQQSTLGNINGIWNTQQNLGQGAQTALGTALGTNGKPADYSGFQNMPGYQFAVQQGTQAIQRQAASMGNAYTPNTAEAVGQYVTGTAAQDYNTYINQLMGAAGLGSTANTALTGANMGVGANISQLQQNQGQAQASGVSGAANAVGGLFSPNGAGTSLIGAAGKALTGGGGGGATASGVGGVNPFAGTNLANNSGAYQAYNAANGPTAGDIASSTSGIGNIDTSSFDPNNFSAQYGGSAFDDVSSNFNNVNFVDQMPNYDNTGNMGFDLGGSDFSSDWGF